MLIPPRFLPGGPAQQAAPAASAHASYIVVPKRLVTRQRDGLSFVRFNEPSWVLPSRYMGNNPLKFWAIHPPKGAPRFCERVKKEKNSRKLSEGSKNDRESRKGNPPRRRRPLPFFLGDNLGDHRLTDWCPETQWLKRKEAATVRPRPPRRDPSYSTRPHVVLEGGRGGGALRLTLGRLG